MDIDSYLSLLDSDPAAQPGNPAHDRAAIRRHRETMRPFVRGWVNARLATLFPWREIDAALAQEEHWLAGIKELAPEQIRLRDAMCARIGAAARIYGDDVSAPFTDVDVARFVATVLDLAEIGHPDPDSHPERMNALVFPQPKGDF